MRIGTHVWLSLVVFAAVGLSYSPAYALKVGEPVKSVQVKDAKDNAASIPDIGAKVVTIFYTDPDVKDQNEPFRDLLKAANLDKSKYRGVGVVNMKDTWKPNFIIRKIVRGKIEKFKALILTDPDHLLKKAWNLGDCDEKDVVIIIGKDKRVQFIKSGPMSAGEQKQNLELIKQLMAK
jgi:predicted transcriptional regulator